MEIPLWAYPLLVFFDLLFWLAHEAGHVIAWRMMGVSPKRIAFKWWPFVLGIEYDADESELRASQKLLGAAAGPIASFYFAWLCLQIPLAEFQLLGVASVLAGVLSLLPLPKTDGWKIGKYSYQTTKQGASCITRKIIDANVNGILQKVNVLLRSTIVSSVLTTSRLFKNS